MDLAGIVPLVACVVVLFGAFLLNRMAAREVARLGNAGRVCAVCSYDLRATPQRCPECGTVVTVGLPLRPPLQTVTLSTEWPASPIAPRSPGPDDEPVLLFDTDNAVQAELLGEQLRARGVAAKVVQGKPFNVASGYDVRQVVYWKVVIWSSDVDAAVRVVERFRPAVDRAETHLADSPASSVPVGETRLASEPAK